MKNIQQYILRDSSTIRDALIKINSIRNHMSLTLFIVNDKDQMLGTLTDGDIRRKLVNGMTLDTSVKEAIFKDFRYIPQGCKDVAKIKEMKNAGITLLPVLDQNNHIIDIYDLKQQRSILPIDAVLMAGGKGERLRPLTEKTPKPLLLVGDKAIIDHNVDRLISYGIEHISVTVNYLKEQIEEHYSQPKNGVMIQTIREPKFLGTLGSVKFIERFYNDTILVMNSDLLTNMNYEDFYVHFVEHKADMSVASVPYSISVPYGIFDLDGRDIKGVFEKPIYHYYANAGIYLIKKSVLQEIPDNTFFNATDLIEKLICRGKKVIRFPHTGYWIDIGKMEEYHKAQELIKHIQK